MAVFGAPLAHEDDAERAVRAALSILEAVPELNGEHREGWRGGGLRVTAAPPGWPSPFAIRRTPATRDLESADVVYERPEGP